MKHFFAIILSLVCTAGLLIAVNGCHKEDDDDSISNTLLLRGTTMKINMALFAQYDDFYNFDLDAGGDHGVHGYGGFEAAWIGKTTDLKGPFFMSFNPQDGGSSIDPVIKSGTVKITEVKGGLHILVEAVEENGQKLKIDVLAEDEFKKNWD